jgi:3-hydroxybutyryl-CoA dehydrogenase
MKCCWNPAQIVSGDVFEDLALKRGVFAELAEAAPGGPPLTSNSSTLLASEISAGLLRVSSIMNLHFVMPAHRVPLVEVLATPDISREVVARVWGIMLAIGKKPVRLSRAMPGLLANRIQAALMREALALVDEGIASAADVDTAVPYGFGFRYAACGPMLQKEHSGWDISYKVYEAVFPTLANHASPPAVLQQMVVAGELGMKTGPGFANWTLPAASLERSRFNAAMDKAFDVLSLDREGDEPEWGR